MPDEQQFLFEIASQRPYPGQVCSDHVGPPVFCKVVSKDGRKPTHIVIFPQHMSYIFKSEFRIPPTHGQEVMMRIVRVPLAFSMWCSPFLSALS